MIENNLAITVVRDTVITPSELNKNAGVISLVLILDAGHANQ